MKKRPTNDDSDEFDADEPEEFEESGSDWDPEEEGAGKKRKSKTKITPKKPANIKKKKIEKSSLDDEEAHENEEDEEDSDEEAPDEEHPNGTTNSNVSVRAFTNGSFVVLKSDIQAKENPPIWKIDGKALLQKYVPFEQGGKVLYKNTSTYSGWTPSNQDQYAPAPVTYVEHGKKEIIIEFNKSSVEERENTDGMDSKSSETTDA